MGYKMTEEQFATEAEAIEDQNNARAFRSLVAEKYPRGHFKINVIDQKTGETKQVFVSKVETYYG